MMLIIFVFLEAVTVLILLNALYGQKMHLDWISVLFIICDCVLMSLIRFCGLNQNSSFIIYFALLVYCIMEFKTKISEMIVNMVLLAIIMMGIQLPALLILDVLGDTIKGYEDLSVAIINAVILAIVIIIIKKIDLHTISTSFLRKGKIIGIILIFESTLLAFLLYQYKSAQGEVPVQYIVITGVLVLILMLCVHTLLYKIRFREKQAELEAYKTYSAAFSDLITQIRARQHEFDNHISALCNLHYICKDYDELVQEQSKYAKDVISNNRFHKLLVSGNPVIAGFLYGKLSSIQEQGIEVTYTFHISEFTSKIPVYLVVELVGNLLKNAVEAVKTQQVEKQIHLSCTENENEFCLGVRNRSEKIPLDEIGRFFEKGYSSKGTVDEDWGYIM